MQQSKELMDKAGVLPRLRLGIKKDKGGVDPTGPHRVKLLSDEYTTGIDPESGKEIGYIDYTLEEDGVKKIYRTRAKDKKTGELSYLVQRLSEIPEGTEVIMEMKKAGIKNYIHVLEYGDQGGELSDEDQPESN